MKQKILVAPILAFLILSAACQPASLRKAANDLKTVAKTVNQTTDAVITANKQGLISDPATGKILAVLDKTAKAGQQADAIVRQLNTLDPNSKVTLANLLKPINDAVNLSLVEDVAGIKDEATKQKVQLLFGTLQATMNSLALLFQ